MNSHWGVIGAILRFFGLQNVIVIEAERTKRENTEAVFRELIRRGWNKKRIVLYSNDPEAIKSWKQKNVSIVKRATYGDSKLSFLRFRWLRLRARLIIDENLQTTKYDPKTTHVYLPHGSCLKSVRNFYDKDSTSKIAREMRSHLLTILLSNLFTKREKVFLQLKLFSRVYGA